MGDLLRLIKEQGKRTGEGSLFLFTSLKNPLFTGLSSPLQEYPKNARRVPLNALQFSKNWQLRPLFLAYFCLLQIGKPLFYKAFKKLFSHTFPPLVSKYCWF